MTCSECLDCDRPVSLKHGKKIDCEIIDNKEQTTFECDEGFEFKAGINRRTAFTNDGVLEDVIQCNGKSGNKIEIK